MAPAMWLVSWLIWATIGARALTRPQTAARRASASSSPVAATTATPYRVLVRQAQERCVWLHEFETLDEAREVIATHIDGYHHRPHSGLNYRTPAEVAQTWDDALGDPQTPAA